MAGSWFAVVLPLIFELISTPSTHGYRTPGIPGQQQYEIYYKWKQVDYTFPNNSLREQLLTNGSYVQVNCIPTGIKIFQDKVFVMTPRYLKGVPSTLNVIPYRKSWIGQQFGRNNSPKLTPFPSWEMQEVGDCSKLQLVQAVELDPYNRLWIVDVGRSEILTPAPKNLCPAKLVIIDLANNNQIERVHIFPDQVAPRNTNAIKDTQIACISRAKCFAYISNLNETNSLIVYDYENDDSWFATHSSMLTDPDKMNITIDGITAIVPFGITGLGLSPKSTGYSTLYFSKISGDRIYSVDTSILNVGAALKANPNLPDNVVRDHGEKLSGQADGAAMDNKGRWYFGSLPESAVYHVDTTGNPSALPKTAKVVGSTTNMQWPDTFSFDGVGNLLVMTNRFQRFAENQVNPNEVNYRLIRFKTESVSYQSS